MQISSSIKKALHQRCLTLAEDRIVSLQHILKEAQQAANNETKSSAGDKHETGRAMAQLETEKLTAQLSEALNIKQNLTQINPTITNNTVVLGSMVYTNKGNFYMAASIGKVTIANEVFFAISPASPIGKLLLTKKEKESFSLNDNEYTILAVI
ncbi:MAG: 3-oxoacyl-ACP synthase [Flavobacteriales bacterium]|nr:3-oxoacyl-ACP synthase [Flavobacteriales bacterium]|tara:strand:+ start:64569 stop:65030 length:462 start_codon:yes stop_codon:yes gene_type:complete